MKGSFRAPNATVIKMKKTTIRILSLILAGCMVLPLVSCKKENEEPGTSDTESEETENVAGDPSKTALLSTAEFHLVGDELTCSVESLNPDFDFSNRITVQKKAKWTLSSDAGGNEVIASKKVTLTPGENVYFIKVTNGEETKMYRATINYSMCCTVSFYANTAEGIKAQKLAVGSTVQKPDDPKREGYTFLGWFSDGVSFDFGSAVNDDIVLIAHWQKLSDEWTYSDQAPHFTDTSAALNIVWKDYDNNAGLRPSKVVCVLTENDGSKEISYPVNVGESTAEWQNGSPEGAVLTVGAGNWTVKITGLSNGKTYTFRQTALTDDYSTQQVGTSVINTVSGYVASVDSTAKLTARNSRLYDAAGNLIVLQGVVTWNVGVDGFETSLSESSLSKLKAIGVNCVRVTVQIVGVSGVGYVYKKNPDDTGRTGDCSDATHQRTTENYQRQILELLDYAVTNASNVGMYIIVDWGILTSDPNQHIADAQQFFGTVAGKYADNPYVLYEICNEPETSAWADVKAYGEKLIETIRGAGSDGIIILAPNHSATHLSNIVGSDPIHEPLDDDRGYNVAYSFHCYPGNYIYENEQYTYGWRVKDAYEAGLTVIVTEFSPMDGTFGSADPLSFDMQETEKYLRQFREYDIGYCYFRCASAASSSAKYNENHMFRPFIDLSVYNWTVNDMTECGKWYYYLLTGDGVMTAPDYSTIPMKVYRKTCQSIGAEYGLKNVFPGFAVKAEQNGNTWFFLTGANDTLSDILYTEYCQALFAKISALSGDIPIYNFDSETPFNSNQLPGSTKDALRLSYYYESDKVGLTLSYGANPFGSGYGLILTIQ